MREPDSIDSARVLALALLAMAVSGFFAWRGFGVVAGVIQGIGFLAIPPVYARCAGLRPFVANGFTRLPVRRLLLVLVASLGTFWLLNGLTHLVEMVMQALGRGPRVQEQAEQILQGIRETQKRGVVPTLIAFVVIPPLVEEMFFRGILFRGITKRFGLAVSLIGTSLLFAAFHPMDAQKVLMVFLGCYFGVLVYLTGSLWSSMLAHAVNNLAVVLLSWIYGDSLKEMTGPWWMYVLSALVFGLAMTGLVLDRKPSTA